MSILAAIKHELNKASDVKKAVILSRYFKTGPGGYAEGDQFIGVVVPHQRGVARKFYRLIPMDELAKLMCDPVHEYRLTAIFMLVLKFERAENEAERKVAVDFYLDNITYINNWDLVDSSATKILGAYLFRKNRNLLYQLAGSGNLWKQRIAVIATLYFIRRDDFDDTFRLTVALLQHEHDLIHKAVGWMLREIGKRDFEEEYAFLKVHYHRMPRTMLRYAIEKFEPGVREQFLKGIIK